jgi:hypothetical protein
MRRFSLSSLLLVLTLVACCCACVRVMGPTLLIASAQYLFGVSVALCVIWPTRTLLLLLERRLAARRT